ncbi:MAG: hypothetical protein IJQ07_00240 [Clostridia bacterium]|nr:hypothetical protein [Clostridia bacterium]
MKTFIYCKTEKKGEQTFYLNHYGKTYYLFTQAYRVSVRDRFQTGYIIDNGYHYSSTHGVAVRKTLDKIKQAIPYIEKEFNICVLRKTKKKERDNYTRKTDRRYSRVFGYESDYGFGY